MINYHPVGARQVFDLSVDLVQSSCGMAVLFFDYIEERNLFEKWAIKKGDAEVQDYWQEKNQQSLDGKSTYIMDKST